MNWTRGSNFAGQCIIKTDTTDICNVFDAEANANLIAAAPDLLENIIHLIDRIEENNLQDHFPSTFARAKEAIKKATE